MKPFYVWTPLESYMDLYGIVGAGGFGREVMPVAENMLRSRLVQGKYELVFIEKNDGNDVNGHRVLSEQTFLKHTGKTFFNIAIASSAVRERVAHQLQNAGSIPFSIIAPNSINLSPTNSIGAGAIFCHFTTVTSNAKIGRYFHANIYSYVAHDVIIGDYVTFAPNVHCNGHVIIEDNVYIGAGAILKDGTLDRPLVIGKGAIVGMGAVVTKNVAAGAVVVGNPAALLQRKVNEQYA